MATVLISDKGDNFEVVVTGGDDPEISNYEFDDYSDQSLKDAFQEMLDNIVEGLGFYGIVNVSVSIQDEVIQEKKQENHALDNYDHDRTGRGGDTVSKLLHDLACKLSEKCEHGHRFSDHPACLRRELGLEEL